MDRNTRHRMLSTGRGGEFHNLVVSMTNHSDHLPGKAELTAELERIYPDLPAESRARMLGNLVEIAKARKAGMDPLELRGICAEYVIKVETQLAEEDRLIPSEDTEPEDVAGALASIDGFDPTQKNVRALSDSLKAAELDANARRQS
jgi:hypothetical protein